MARTVDHETTYAPPRTSEGIATIEPPSAGVSPAFAPERPKRIATRTRSTAGETKDSLFEQFAWLYVFFRENLFRDDTDRFIRALWPDLRPRAGTRVIELGCGPGFYSCALAARFPSLSVVGVDRSEQQLNCATRKANALSLRNCTFARDNVLDLSARDETFDTVIAARLFTVLPQRTQAIAEVHRVLRPGGRCLVAEPRYAIWASLPLLAMWLIAGITRMRNGYREPRVATVLRADEFRALFATQPWQRIETWEDGRYQYALCEKR
jgi:ubiquinone/menaquinone biosynthesis C-methylase UbiE